MPTITVERHHGKVSDDDRQSLMAAPRFGNVFTDHMFTARWREDRGWYDARIGARAPFTLDPACAVLHYAQEIFEGMKAYRTVDGGTALFRPEQNARRFAESAARLSMPAVSEALFLEAVRALVEVDRQWIPEGDGSLYLRPFMFASEAFLGVRPAAEYVFCVIACPVGPYFSNADEPITVWVSEEFTRAAAGGTGAAKCGGNYAASLLAQAEAKRHGCDQVVFLDATEHRWIEELGGMNVFFVMADNGLITPPLGGTILPGITRDALLTLARDCGLRVEERPYSLKEWRQDATSGRLVEAFACGTAAVVAGIGVVRSPGGEFRVADGRTGRLTADLRTELTALQRGAHPDRHGWVVPVG